MSAGGARGRGARPWLAGALVLAGAADLVGGCRKRAPPVAFHSDAGARAPAVDAGDGGVDGAVFAPVASSPVAGDGGALVLDGGTLAAPPGERFVAWLEAELDGVAASREVVVVRARDDGGIAGVGAFRRAGTGYEPLPMPAARPTDSRCSDARLRWTSPRSLVVSYRCLAGLAGVDGGAPPSLGEEHVVVGLGEPSAERLRVGLVDPELPGVAAALRVEGIDRDGDGRDDVVVSVSAGPAEREAGATATLVYLDRPGGFARDTAEPGASLAVVLEGARRGLVRRRAGALAALAVVEDLERLRRVLCEELGVARLRVGEETGVDCRGVGVFAAAAELEVRALAALGELPAAFARTRPETSGELGAVTATRVFDELERAARSERGVVARAGPFVAQDLTGVVYARSGVLVLEPSTMPSSVRLRGPVTGTVAREGLAFTPGEPGPVAEVVPRSPDGSLALVGFVETCAGVAAVVCPASAPACAVEPLRAGAAGVPPGAVLGYLSDRPSLARARRCVRGERALAVLGADASLAVVGWGAEGLVVAWRARLYRVTPGGGVAVPLTVPDALGRGFPPGSAANARGTVAVVAGSEGVWVRDLSQWRRWAPEELAGRYRQLTDASVSDDGRFVAALLGTQLWTLELSRVARSRR